MKTFSVAVAAAVVLTFICVLESSAVPSTEVEEPDQMTTNESPAGDQEETSVDSWTMPVHVRQKRGIKCRFCCGCCERKVCGLCCKFKFKFKFKF